MGQCTLNPKHHLQDVCSAKSAAVLLYCETLVTASEATLKPLEKTHNQALQLITGGIQSTPIDTMLLVIGNGTIRSFVKEKTLTLYEKLLRILSDAFWST
nr:pol protein [Hymenolepis microstoma]